MISIDPVATSLANVPGRSAHSIRKSTLSQSNRERHDFMNFHSKSIGDELLAKLGQATKIQIASAFFCPNDPLLSVLKSVPQMELIVSEEFTISDPSNLSS